jgi:hypothetical protein
MLNRLFADQGRSGEPGRIRAATVAHGESVRRQTDGSQVASLPPDPRHPGKHIDPATGIWPIAEWGPTCRRGFLSDRPKAKGDA